MRSTNPPAGLDLQFCRLCCWSSQHIGVRVAVAKKESVHTKNIYIIQQLSWSAQIWAVPEHFHEQGNGGWPSARLFGWTRVTRMAYSLWLWLMAIGWWNKINQCRKLKLNLTQTWGVCMIFFPGMHWSQNQWYCVDKPERNKFRAQRRRKRTQSWTFLQKGLCISCASRTLQHTCRRKAHASHLELLHTHIYHKC